VPQHVGVVKEYTIVYLIQAFQHCKVAIATLYENHPNWEKSFASRHNLNVSLACYLKFYNIKNWATKCFNNFLPTNC
jgi:hypothetical protein